ncbi:hypothetical protein GCM10007941_05270 [Amphritea balenae]|nr:hypothetical protein GCM10007941_05270 [Amphritea balenae]
MPCSLKLSQFININCIHAALMVYGSLPYICPINNWVLNNITEILITGSLFNIATDSSAYTWKYAEFVGGE